jgi:hypothetical protein
VGVGNPAEETCRYPNQILIQHRALPGFVNAQKNQENRPCGVVDSLTSRPNPQSRKLKFGKLEWAEDSRTSPRRPKR